MGDAFGSVLQKLLATPQELPYRFGNGDPIAGLDTVMDWGNTLSLGEQQRLAFGRVLVNQPKLIILDEATSALDNATESRVVAELHDHAASSSRTVIMVAHRLTTLRGADRVLVMDDGRIVQDGSYGDLAEASGVFRKLLQYNQ